MKQKALFFHAGCAVCRAAEEHVIDALDATRIDVEKVHLGDARARIDEAANLHVQWVPALVLDGEALHINYGIALSDLRERH